MTNKKVLLIIYVFLVLLGIVNELICQPYVMGPRWFRWHISSIAHASISGYYLFLLIDLIYFIVVNKELAEKTGKMLAVITSCVPAVIYEIRQGKHFDPVDVGCLMMGGMLAYFILPTFFLEPQIRRGRLR